MRLITKQVPMNFNIFQFSCTHWGSMFTHKSGWEKLVTMLNESYGGLPSSANYAIHHGDMVEAIAIDDPRWSLMGAQPGGIIPQMTQARDKLKPIKSKVITVLQGNHEQRLESRFGDITDWVCNELGIPYGTYSAKISYHAKKGGALLFKQYATHGYKGINSSADDLIRRRSNMRLSLKRTLSPMAGDTILMTKGHTHRLIIAPPESELFLVDDGNRIHQMYTFSSPSAPYIDVNLRWYVNVGAFFRMYGDDVVSNPSDRPLEGVRSSYAEIAEYAPIELGFAVVMVRDGQITNVKTEIVD